MNLLLCGYDATDGPQLYFMDYLASMVQVCPSSAVAPLCIRWEHDARHRLRHMATGQCSPSRCWTDTTSPTCLWRKQRRCYESALMRQVSANIHIRCFNVLGLIIPMLAGAQAAVGAAAVLQSANGRCDRHPRHRTVDSHFFLLFVDDTMTFIAGDQPNAHQYASAEVLVCDRREC